MAESGTNLGPLTTTFTPPPQCTVAIAQCATCNEIWLGQACERSTGAKDATTCWPPTTSVGVPSPAIPLAGWGFYSPGIHCPAGHTSACSATGTTQRGGFGFQFALVGEETAVGCCPTGFTCSKQVNGWQTCALNTGTGTGRGDDTATISELLVQTVTCDVSRGQSGGLGVLTAPRAGVSVWAPMIQINFQSSDLPGGGSSSSSEGVGSSGGPSSSTGVSRPPGTVENQGSDSGISTGAIAGIAVGVVALVLGILGAAFFIWRRKRSQQRGGENGVGSSGGQTGGAASGGGEYYSAIGTHPQGPDMRHLEHPRSDSPAYTAYSGGGYGGEGVVPVAGANGAQEGKYYYSGHPAVVAEADGRPVERVEAPGAEYQPRELAG